MPLLQPPFSATNLRCDILSPVALTLMQSGDSVTTVIPDLLPVIEDFLPGALLPEPSKDPANASLKSGPV